MKKTVLRLWMLMALPMLLGLTSCNNAEDNPVVMNPLAEQVKGLWWAVYSAEGTTTDGQAYTHVGQALQLSEDGTGYAATFYFDDETDKPIEVRGGKSIAPFTYTTDWDGNISLTFSKGYKEDTDYYATWTLRHDAGRISMTAPTDACLMEQATASEQLLIEQLDAAANGGAAYDTPYNEQRTSIDSEGEQYQYQYKFTLNKYIDKYGPSGTKDWLNKDGSISIDFKVSPVYMQSANGSKAGDYYFVKATVTPHNNSLWGPYKQNHAWAQIRIYGFWMKDLDFTVELQNEDGTAVEGLRYYERPIPENQNDSRNYTNGKTISLTGTLSGGYSEKQGMNGGASVSCGGTWSSSTSYTLTSLAYRLDTSSPKVNYYYYTENVKLSDNWDNKEKNFPTACHSEFSAHSYWVWFVPSNNTSGSKAVKDGSTNRFRLKASVKATYSSWYHWRSAVEYDSNRSDYDDAKFDKTFDLPRPDRTPWGIIALKNASSYEMAHVKFYKSGEESKDPVATLTNSYSKDQVAKQGLTEGTYTVTYDFMDPNNNQVLSRWKVENVKVHQGRDEASATTSASTVDAVEVK